MFLFFDLLWILCLFGQVNAAGDSIWDYAPEVSHDPAPPYPPLKNPDGSNITTENLRGTRLYGWADCQTNEINDITEAWNDFHTLANQDSVYKNIDWSENIARDFWGPSTGPNAIPDSRKTEILQIYQSAQQMFDRWWWPPDGPWVPPYLWWKYLWLEVRCSGPKGDPNNKCKDRPDGDDNCAVTPRPPSTGDNRLEAVIDNREGDWPAITFCTNFFNLYSLSDAMKFGNMRAPGDQNNLEIWNNRARCFLHEVTHMDYFMNTPQKSPYVDDLTFQYTRGGRRVNGDGYGPYFCKMIRNYVRRGKGGYYTQHNADTYAWYALAKYVQSQINRYPNAPSPGTQSPVQPPRDHDGNPLIADVDVDAGGLNEDLIGGDDSGGSGPVPGCPDRSDAPGSMQAACGGAPLSGVPFNVFSSDSGNVYSGFCNAVNANTANALSWNVSSTGQQKTNTRKRTPPPNPSAYANYNFALDWEPSSEPTNCSASCNDAYAYLTNSPCGHQGGEQNIMALTGNIDVTCGVYTYAIIDESAPAAPPPPSNPSPTLAAQSCFPSGAFGHLGDVEPDGVISGVASICKQAQGKSIKAGDASTRINYHTTNGNPPYNFTIWWQDSCQSSVTEVDATKPFSGNNDVNCTSLLTNDYYNCNNGGIGGSITAGCVVYEFKTSLD